MVKFKQAAVIPLFLTLAMLLGGCVGTKTVKMKPTMESYTFLQDVKPLKGHYQDLYRQDNDQSPLLSARFSEPHSYTVKFHNNNAEVIGAPVSNKIPESKTFQFRKGVYPFSLYRDKESTTKYSGLLAVYDIDETIELATFGESEETRLLNRSMFEQAEKGVLASYTISFDNREVMTYWIGNRRELYPGGRPTVEVDFSDTTELRELKIGDRKIKNFRTVLNLDKMYICSLCNKVGEKAKDFKDKCPKASNGKHRPKLKISHKNYPVEMVHNSGTTYQGYIRNMTSNIFTAFMSIPFDIPSNLFEDAARGTISKLTVYSAGDDKEEIAELVFGLAK